jgi:drug/metabolite transporter (DMT)-like permease
MPLSALALVVAAAFLHALWNIAAKHAGGNHHFALASALMVAVLWLPAGLWFGWDEVPRWTALQWALVLASAFVHLLYYHALLAGYRAADLTVVYPVARGSGPLLSALGAVLLLGEPGGWGTALGVLMVCGGVFFVAGGPGLWRQGHDPAQRGRVLAGLRWGALTGALIACYTVIDGYAIKVALMGPVIFDYVCNLLRVPMMLPLLWRDVPGFRAALRAQWRHALVVAAISPLAYILVLYALQQAPLSHVAPAREMSMLFAAALGGRLLGETDRGLRLVGAACIATGVALLATMGG